MGLGDSSKRQPDSTSEDDSLADVIDRFLDVEESAGRLEQISELPARGSAAEIGPGAILGEFELVNRIGSGGMGVVYAATDVELGRRYADAWGVEPDEYDLDLPNRSFAEQLARRGIETVDTLPLLRDAIADGRAVYGSVDRHLSPEGHAVVAEAVLPRVEAWLEDAR